MVNDWKKSSPLSANRPILMARDAVKTFAGKRVVDEVSFTIAQGETFAFLGPNGAGKTTTIRMLTTLLHADSGEITIDGINVTDNPLEARRRFGVVFQESTLDTTMTVRENLWMHCSLYKIPRKLRRERIAAALEQFGLSDYENDLAANLSGGLKRRVEIARALLHKPSLLFLDEPTLGLDPQSRSMLWEHLEDLRQRFGTTIFLTTHYLDEVERFAHNIAVLHQGRIVAQGSVEALIQQVQGKTLEDAFLALIDPSLESGERGSTGKNEKNPRRAL